MIHRLKGFNLKEFNDPYPTILIEAEDPDDACYKVYCLFIETILKQKESKETAKLLKDVNFDFKIKHVYCK